MVRWIASAISTACSGVRSCRLLPIRRAASTEVRWSFCIVGHFRMDARGRGVPLSGVGSRAWLVLFLVGREIFAAVYFGDAALVPLGHADEAFDVVGDFVKPLLVGALGLGDSGEALFIGGKAPFIVALHGGDDFHGLGEPFDAVVYGAGFGRWVVRAHGEWASPVFSVGYL